MILSTLLFAAVLGEPQTAQQFGMNPFMQQSPFKTLPDADNPAVMQIFTDGVDAKDAREFIAAGMLPRYLPLLTDGVDTGDAWLFGLGTPGATEDSVIARAQMEDPVAAQMHQPANEELLPIWMQIVAAGLNIPPTPAGGADNATEATDAGGFGNGALVNALIAGEGEIGEGLGEGMAMAGAFGELGGGGIPLIAGNGPIEEYGDSESNAALQALGCQIGYPAPEEANVVCMMQQTEADCTACQPIGCFWSGSCIGIPKLQKTQEKTQSVNLQNTEPEQSDSSTWTEDINPVYTLTLGVLAGSVFGCGLGMLYSRCNRKQNAFEEAMIHLDDAQV